MRDPERIEEFMNELGKLWKENLPDIRFGQLLCIIPFKRDIFFMEESEFLAEVKDYIESIKKKEN